MKYRIMVIEDDPVIREELCILLKGNGYEVGAVTDFTDTLEQIREWQPHLLLLDINLPFRHPDLFCRTDHFCYQQEYGYG